MLQMSNVSDKNKDVLPLVVGINEVRCLRRQLDLETFNVNLGDTTV